MRIKFSLIILIFILLSACTETPPTPKPREYYRVNFPDKKYQLFSEDYPYSFEYPTYAQVVPDTDDYSEPYWINLEFPAYNASIHISYKKVNNDIGQFIEDSHTLAYKHAIKADAINEAIFINDTLRTYCKIYSIEGNAATPMQFHITDSVSNFLRGSLYFKVSPNRDSLAPSIDYLIEDVIHLMETFEWKN